MKFRKIDWKEYFYFRKNEKIAVILLLFFIVVCSVAYTLSGVWRQSYNYDDDALSLAEFDEFQKNLNPVFYGSPKTDTNSDEAEETSGIKKTNTKAKQEKLKEGQSIDLNSANTDALKRIPGIGETYAQRIITYRNLLGGFASPEQIMEVQGISKKKYENIRTFLAVKRQVKKIKINKLTKEQLAEHPYIDDEQAANIIKYRLSNQIESSDNLRLLKCFSEKDINRLSDYLSFD